MELHREGGLAVNLACADFDGDGYPDSIAYSRTDQASAGGSAVGGLTKGPLLEIISGQSGKVLWEHRYDSRITGVFGSTDAIPAIPVSDMGGDGLPDLAFTQTDSGQGYVETVRVYNVKRNQLLKEIALNEPARDHDTLMRSIFPSPDKTFPGGNIHGVPDCASAGENMLVILSPALDRIDSGGGGWSAYGVTHPIVVGLANEVVLRFLLPCSVSAEIDSPGSLAALHSGGGLCFLSMSGQSPLVSPIEGSIQSSPIHVRLDESAGRGLTEVYLDHVSCRSTYGQQITLPADAGAHRLTVYTLDLPPPNGASVNVRLET